LNPSRHHDYAELGIATVTLRHSVSLNFFEYFALWHMLLFTVRIFIYLNFSQYRDKLNVRRSTYFPCRRFLGDVRREFLQRLSAALHSTLGSYIIFGALQEGSSDVVACLPVPRAQPCGVSFLYW
jgi:hypothetical protein